ncbi:MAG: hypothetical protein ACRCX2_19395 [Paraclostridium sp.]
MNNTELNFEQGLNNLKINIEGWERSRRDIALDLYKKMINVSIKKQLDIVKFSIEDIKTVMMGDKRDDFYTQSYGYMQVTLSILRDIYKIFNVDMQLKTEDFRDLINPSADDFYSIEEIRDICNLFINPQDKFIVYGLFCGIASKELTELKIEDVDFKNKEIKCKSKTIKMDEYLEDIIKDATDTIFGCVYYVNIDNGTSGTTSESYNLNKLNPHIIKPKPSSKNNDGLEKMKESGLRTRLTRLSDLTGFKLLANKLIRSGIMHGMIQFKKDWTAQEVRMYLKAHNISAQPYELLRAFNLKYNR